MIPLTIINIVCIVILVVLIFTLYNMINYFGEVVVKFVEQNQEYYKNQKHLVEKVSQTVIDQKKISGSLNEMKRSISKLQEISRSIDIKHDVESLKAEISKLSNMKHKQG